MYRLHKFQNVDYIYLYNIITVGIIFLKITLVPNHVLLIKSIIEKMQVVQLKNNDNAKYNALLVPKNEWERLNKILTKNDDDRAAVEKAKRLKDERSALSKAMAETWGNSMLLV